VTVWLMVYRITDLPPDVAALATSIIWAYHPHVEWRDGRLELGPEVRHQIGFVTGSQCSARGRVRRFTAHFKPDHRSIEFTDA